MNPFQLDDKVLVNSKHAEIKTLKDIGEGHFEVGVVYTEDKRFDTVIYPFTEIQKMDSPIESAKKLQFEPSWKYDLATDALRFKHAYLYDPLFSLSTTRIDALPHQIEAVYDKILPAHEQRFLIADDPGLGKTIMAGMVIKELRARDRAKRVLIVTPAPLTRQWARELRELFELEFMRYDAPLLYSLRSNMASGGNPWYKYNWIITSLDFIKKEEIRIELGKTKWDMVIFDEAHKLKAYKYGDKIDRKDRYKIGAILADYECSDNLLLLTATPHDGNAYPFYALLQLIDPYIAQDEYSLLPERTEQIIIRRLKEDVTKWDGTPLFKPRHVKSISIDYDEEGPEFKFYENITNYVTHHYNKSKGDEKKRAVGFAMVILQKRMVSSLFSIKKSLKNRAFRLRDALDKRETALEALKELPKDLDEYDQEYEDLEDERREEIEEHLLAITTSENPKEIELEIRQLEGLIDEVDKIPQDTKAEKFLEFVKGVFEENPDEKLIVFTEYRDTLSYLAGGISDGKTVTGILEKAGFALTQIHGSMDMESRQQAENEFRDKAQILVATDAAGEGLNFQFAHIMINYELPWNPNRLEQRMGRLHRYGQDKEVFIYNLLISNTREGAIFERLFEKMEIIRQELGERVFDVLGSLLQDVNFTDLVMNVLSRRPNQIEKVIEKCIDIKVDEKKKNLINKVEKEALIRQNIHLDPQIQKSILSKESSIDHNDMERFIDMAIEKWDTGSLKSGTKELFSLKVPLEFVDNSTIHPRYDNITFDRNTANKLGRGKATFMAVGHPFVDRLIDYILRPQWGGKIAVKLDVEGRMGIIFNYITQSKDYGQNIVAEQIQTYFWKLGEDSLQQVNPQFHWEFKEHSGVADDLEKEELYKVISHIDEIEAKANQQAVQDAIDFTKELADKRYYEVEIKEKDAERFFTNKIKRLEEKLRSQKDQASHRDMALAIRNTESELERTEFDFKTRLQKLQQEKNLAFHSPVLQNICLIIPDKGKSFSPEETELKRKIELAGMDAVMEYEKENNRTPVDISMEFVGYDVKSSSKEGFRYIEVKAFKTTGTVEMTENEWITAKKLGDDYWLYIVENALNEVEMNIFTVRNPSERFKDVKIVQRDTRYLISDWKAEL